jgi:hypothetical protein
VSLRFPYLTRPSHRPVVPLGGVLYRRYPIFPVNIIAPNATTVRDGLLDTGADDTIYPESIAQSLAIDLTGALEGEARGIGGPSLRIRFATVRLRITDFKETCEWDAIVGFAPLAMGRMLFGPSDADASCCFFKTCALRRQPAKPPQKLAGRLAGCPPWLGSQLSWTRPYGSPNPSSPNAAQAQRRGEVIYCRSPKASPSRLQDLLDLLRLVP